VRPAPQELARRLGYHFQNISLLLQALKHPSYVNERPSEGPSNQRLEFLGDAVLELVVSQRLYELFPEATEGQLSRARAAVVGEGALARVARELGLGNFLLLGRGEALHGGRDKPSILSDALEAVIAAVYLDGGLGAARAVVERIMGRAIAQALRPRPPKDPKTLLQEDVQAALHEHPRYHLVGTSGPDHAKWFTVAVEIAGVRVAEAMGRSKKEAEQQAAARALGMWKEAVQSRQKSSSS